MRTLSARFAMAAMLASIAFAQSPFYFTQPATKQDMNAMATLIRTVADIRDVSVDEPNHSLVVQSTEDKMLIADWVFHQLDKPAGQNHAGPVPEYQMPGPNGELIKIIYVPASTAFPEITAAVTAIRTIADAQRLFPMESQKAIVVRATAARVAAVEWLMNQLNPIEGTAPTMDSAAYPSPVAMESREPDAVIRVFRMNPDTSNSQLVATVTAIRTVADVQRLFPYEAGKAIIASGPVDKLATAAWIIHERLTATAPPATHETTLAGEVVRMFYVDPQKSQADLTALVTQIRTKTGIARIFPFAEQAAIVLRGKPDQIPTVDAMVAEYGAGAGLH